MAKAKKQTPTQENLLEQALIPEAEQPYPVPDNWVWVRLICILSDIRNGTTVTQNKESLGARVTRIESIQNNRIDFDRIGYIENLNEIKDTDWYVPNDITLSHINSVEHIGKTALINNNLLPLVHGMNLLRLRFTDTCNPRCFYYFSQSFQYKASILQRIKMAVNQVSINQKQIGNIEFPLPPLPEQHRIVERIESLFEKLDSAKELVQSALDSFETRKAAILHKAFTGELTAKWREENGVRLEWEERFLGNIIKDGPQNGLYKPKTAYGAGTRIIRIDGFYDGYIEPWETMKKLILEDYELNLYMLQVNDVLINRVNSMPFLGKSALIRELPEPCVFESNIMRISLDEQAYPNFIIYYLNSARGLSELRKNAKQAVNQASINQQDVKNVIITLPKFSEQLEIVRILDSLFEKEQHAKELAEVVEKIDLMKKAILARAFRGELGTNEVGEESAVK